MHSSRTIKLIGLCFLLLFSVEGSAQDTLNSENVDVASYQLWQQAKWKELEAFGNKALKKGIDSYYLRMRLGIAYFEKKDYVTAQKHFEKARALNASDDALSYLYYCYIYTARYDEARWLSKSFSKELAHTLKTDSVSFIGFIMAEGGEQVSDSQAEVKTGYYGQLGMQHYIGRRISLFHAVTYFTQSDSAGQSTELQYYLQGNIPLGKSWDLSPAFQWIDRGDPVIIKPAKPVVRPGQPAPPKAVATVTTEYSSYFTAALTIKKTISHADISFGTVISKLFNDATEVLHALTINYHPFQWNNFNVGTVLYLHTENSYSSMFFAYNPYVTVRVVKPIALTASYLVHNGGPNIIEDNGYIVNNSKDPTRSRLSFQANCTISRLIDVYAQYEYEDQYNRTDFFPYHYNVFIVGLRIKP